MRPTSFESLDDTSRKIRIADGASETGARLGGRAPEGVTPSANHLVYFFTVPSRWVEDEDSSLFMDQRREFIYGENAGQLLRGPGVELISHPRVPRARTSRPFDSPLSEHALLLSEPEADLVSEDGEGVPYSGHKAGGMPYFIHGERELENAVLSLFERGHRQLIQIDFPGNEGDADVSGPWPVGTALLHVLVSHVGGERDWVCFWER